MNYKKIFAIQYDKNSNIQNRNFLIVLMFLCLIILFYVIIQNENKSVFVNVPNIDKEDSIIMQSEAIVNGKIALMEEPSEKLKNMENPYDNVQREYEKVDFLYDVAYYNGKYYNYFGIAPILTIILPYRILTGKYLQTYIFNLIYIFIDIFALYAVYKKVIDKYIKKISILNFGLGYFAILFGSNLITLIRGAKYDIVISCGIGFLLISLYFAMTIYDNEKNKKLKLILFGISTGLIVLSKPNLIVYYILIFYTYFVNSKHIEKKDKIKDCAIISIPLGILAIFQMFFNYIRFDNVFDFGVKYQLTDFNMVYCSGVTIGKIYAGIMEYILKTPVINPLNFPFVFSNSDKCAFSMNELCYEGNLVGLIGIPIIFAYLFKTSIMKGKKLNYFINLCIITSVIEMILVSCFGGICEPYSIDFKLILSIDAIFILQEWINQSNNDKNINKLYLFLCVFTILIMLPISFNSEKGFLEVNSFFTVMLKNIFEFWT